jgi:hypothetical protein
MKIQLKSNLLSFLVAALLFVGAATGFALLKEELVHNGMFTNSHASTEQHDNSNIVTAISEAAKLPA